MLIVSRVTYILGAGASYGERKKDKDGNVIGFTRGLPIVNELETALQFLRDGEPTTSVRFPVEEAKKRGVSLEDYKNVCHKLSLLKQACASYPTIDTLAKQLFVTGRSFDVSPTDRISYDDLKRYLTTALLMLQNEKKRDLRYDGFIASLIDQQKHFPEMTILSWNYDVQFEMAYSGYFTTERYIPSLWKELNVFNKKYPTEFNVDAPFAMVKLNGTALFTDASKNEWEVNGKKVNNITDCFYGGHNHTPYQYGYEYLNRGNYENILSYAWEEESLHIMRDIIRNRVVDTRELVVIGYSFPYVNNELDTFILVNMPKLNKIVIQDEHFEDIKERVEGILAQTRRNVKIVPKKSLQQFYIPNRFDNPFVPVSFAIE